MTVTAEFLSAETACNTLEGCAVHVTTLDGVQATGILKHHVPQDGTQTMVRIHNVITDELILGTDIRNFASILVP